MLKSSALAALVLASFASGAFAQTQTQTSQQLNTSNLQARPSGLSSMYENMNVQTKLWRQSMTDDAQPEVTPAQWRRARKAASLINTNHCEDAYKLAVSAQDDRLAGNVAQVCKAHPRS
ncbi:MULTISPECIES: hypothetical protein [unclassified Caulobacter]|jgi:hypothetical protein|uniref:hypothetical protein n=1 Tax=unclassified Caulobacter TaxID=2648921 RepID=UPI000645C82A|nr:MULTISPECIES: hypothetical protein [unclassified Caulobacter]KQV58607.1 hypothetical protein ASC62_07410 [Caulobacter sp. Root342]KQV68884.1 hypothetical protein ASC70_08625 [Caulobacter sp. Root343]